MGTHVFALADWRNLLTFARDIAHRGDADAMAIETVMILGHAPPPVAAATRVRKTAALTLVLWGDTEKGAQALYAKYANAIVGTLVLAEARALVSVEAQ